MLYRKLGRFIADFDPQLENWSDNLIYVIPILLEKVRQIVKIIGFIIRSIPIAKHFSTIVLKQE